MPDSNSYEMLIKFVMDNQGAEKALKTMTDFNNSVKNLTIGLEELDKKGLGSFNKLMDSIASNKTTEATKKIKDLNEQLSNFGNLISRIGKDGFTGIGGGIFSTGASGEGFEKTLVDQYGIPIGKTVKDQMDAASVAAAAGGAGGGGQRGGPPAGFFGGTGPFFTNIAGMAGLGTAGRFLTGAATLAAVPALAIEAASTYSYFETIGQISRITQQEAERAPFKMGMSGNITLQLLEAAGVGEAARRREQNRRLAAGQEYLPGSTSQTDFLNLGALGSLAERFQVGYSGGGILGGVSAVFNPESEIARRAFAERMKQAYRLDLEESGEMAEFLSSAQKIYGQFNRTYQFYDPKTAQSLITRFSTQQEALEAQQNAASAGLRLGDINMANVSLARRFGFSPEAERAVLAFGDPRTTQSRDAYFRILNTINAAPGATELFSTAIAQKQMEFLSYGNVDPFQALSSFTAAGRNIDFTGMTPVQQLAQQQRVSSYLDKQKNPGSLIDVSLITAFQNLGVTNSLAAQSLSNAWKKGMTTEVLSTLKNAGINVSPETIKEEVMKVQTPFIDAAMEPFGEFTKSFTFNPVTLTSLSTKGGKRLDPTEQLTMMFGEAAVDVKTARESAAVPGRLETPQFEIERSAFEMLTQGLKAADDRNFAVSKFIGESFKRMGEALLSQSEKVFRGAPSSNSGSKNRSSRAPGINNFSDAVSRPGSITDPTAGLNPED
jgi:hypothetical protein